jgi:hypothetical protein
MRIVWLLQAAAHHHAAAQHHLQAAHCHNHGQHEEAKKHVTAAHDHSERGHKHSKNAHSYSHEQARPRGNRGDCPSAGLEIKCEHMKSYYTDDDRVPSIDGGRCRRVNPSELGDVQ